MFAGRHNAMLGGPHVIRGLDVAQACLKRISVPYNSHFRAK